jgi:hypothetical protein
MGDGEVSGAINAVAPHPTDENVLYVGAVNGGIWKTANAMDATPKWENLTDDQPSLSIGCLEFDPTVADNNTLVAGAGQFSSFGAGGARIGLLRTTDGGTTWSVIKGGGLPDGLNISGVAPRGDVIVLSVASAASVAHRGIWRTTDKGGAWTQISGAGSAALPAGPSFDLVSDPKDAKRLFTNAGGGYYRSKDSGATWEKVSNSDMEVHLASAQNVEAAAGHDNNIFVAIVGPDRRLAAVFHSENGGASWTDLGVPMVGNVGIHPGGQGSIHLSIAADPANAKLCYVGGDRQHGNFPIAPNAIGAKDFSGCLFRGKASNPPAWEHLTHSKSLGAADGGTASGSAPHADSRDMDVAKNGVLIEGDDGGVYKRTKPQTDEGDWFSMNGNLQTAEYHAVAWDSNAKIVIAGAQDTGSGEQQASNKPRFRSISTADGGVVAVDDTSTTGLSVRYSSNQRLSRFRRREFDKNNNLISSVFIPLTVLDGGTVPAQFYTPIALNAVEPVRLIIGGADATYESLNQGDTCRRLAPGVVPNGSGHDTIAYGAKDNTDVLYVGSSDKVFVRTSPHPAPLMQSATYAGGHVMGIANDVTASNSAFVMSPARVFQTLDAGGTWTDLTANLASLEPGILRSIAFVPAPAGGAGSVLVGSENGVFARQTGAAGAWVRLGAGLPRAPVYHLEYDAKGDGEDERSDILLAGTLGRGAWRLLAPTATASEAIAQLVQNESLPAELAAEAAEAPGAENAADDDQPAQQARAVTKLRDGVIVDPNAKRVYLMRPEGGIEAVQLESGETDWTSKEADKPLDVVADVLISQSAAPEVESVVKIVGLNPETGKSTVQAEQSLPAGVEPSIDETLEGAFSAAATSSGETAFVTWQFRERSASPLPPGLEQGAAPAAVNDGELAPSSLSAPDRVGVRSGVIQLNLATGETASLNVEAPLAEFATAELAESAEDEQLPNIEGDQFRSVDDRHIVGSVRAKDSREWNRYTLAIYDRATGERVGQLKSHLAIVPLMVVGDRIVYEDSPYTRRKDDKLVDEPLKLRVARLETGEELWSRPIRDTSYKGPMPP